MEKFAIDLDKVLDEFEFSEDRAEQTTSIVAPITAATSSVARCSLEHSTLKTYDAFVNDREKSNETLDKVGSYDKNHESHEANAASKSLSFERDADGIQTIDLHKDDSIIGTGGSVNHFYADSCATDRKIVQKQCVQSHNVESEPVSLTIFNNISQKLVQKQQNDNANKIQSNSYDKKLNQPITKPSVSNVFNSLNEYINAPTVSLDYMDTVLERQDDQKDVPHTKNPPKDCNLAKNILKHSNTEELSKQSEEFKETTPPKYQNILIPVKLNLPKIDKDRLEEQEYKESLEESNVTLEDEATANESIHVYENINVNPDNLPTKEMCNQNDEHQSEQQISGFDKSSKSNDNLEAHTYENIGFAEPSLTDHSSNYNQEQAVYDCIYIGQNQNPSETVNSAKPGSSSTENSSQEKQDKLNSSLQGNLKAGNKPIGFGKIGDLSEEELNKYLAELEAEENAKDDHSDPTVSLKTAMHPRTFQKEIDDEDANEAPIFESVMIGELPSVSKEELEEKAKKFPVIDYGQGSTSKDTSGDFLEKQPWEGSRELAEIISASEDTQIKENGSKSAVNNDAACRTELPVNSTNENDLTKAVIPSATYAEKTNVTGKNNNYEQEVEADSMNTVSNNNNFNGQIDVEAPSTGEINVTHEGHIEVDNDRISENCCDKNTEKCVKNLQSEVEEKSKGPISDASSVVEENIHDIESKIPSDANCENGVEISSVNHENQSEDASVEADMEKSSKNVDQQESSSKSNDFEEGETNRSIPRPQSLDIVSVTETNEPQKSASPGVTPEAREQTENEVAEDNSRGPSPEMSDNSSMDSTTFLGKQPPFWVPDNEAPNCMLCEVKFNVLKRRHHCRACGKVLCNKCCSMKFRLEYQGNIDSRVCRPCYQLLTKAESNQGMGDWSPGYRNYASSSDTSASQGRQPNPNNPMEYCSTVPPLQQLAGGLPSPPTVMVPVGVLKREGSSKQRSDGSKSVMFSDGIRPGCDLTELDTSWDLKPPQSSYRKPGNKRILATTTPPNVGSVKRQNLPPLDSTTNSYIPHDPSLLPPTVTMHKGQITYHDVVDQNLLYKTLKNECEPPVMFAINRNLYAYVKIINLNCCVNRVCWNVTSKGLVCVGQDEVILLVETLPDETRIPKDLLIYINHIYMEAVKGNMVTELGVSVYPRGNLLGSREHAGFLFIRQTLQCLQKIILPPAPFLVGILVHRWETPWAKVFPLRLLLRLGAEYRYYPCPLVSVRFRDAVYFEIGHTVMKVLADFRNFAYTLPNVRGLTIHLKNRTTDVMLPRNRYDQVIKGMNNSNDHVLAYSSNFSVVADSHLVCIQTNTGDESSYQTQAINIHNKPRTVTGASFIVINGALKSAMGLSAKSSIVEDGLMVEIMPEKMEALKAALQNMQDFSIGCGRLGAPEPDETVHIKWVDNDVQFNLGVKSPIDGKLMDGIPSIRVHNGTDYKGASRFIRWTEVFIIKCDDRPNGVHDPVDINKLSENIARATCAALVKLLDLLATASLTKLAVRTTIHPDNVGYEAGSEGTKLPPIYMNSLDNELIQVLHKAAQSSQDTHTVLELIFYILDD